MKTSIRYTPDQIRTASNYVTWIRSCKAAFAVGYKRVAYRWPHVEGLTEAEFWREFHAALNNRINSKAGIHFRTGYWNDQETRWKRDQQRLRDIHNRIRVYQFETEEVRRRFGHLLSSYSE